MKLKSIHVGLIFYLFACLFGTALSTDLYAGPPNPGESDLDRKDTVKPAEQGLTAPITGDRLYWKDGLHITGRYKKIDIKLNGNIFLDGGTIDPDGVLAGAFNDLDYSDVDFRKMSASLSGTLFDALAFKLEVDFAHVTDIKDNWIRFTKIPVLKNIRFGHLKEPFSLDELTSARDITFMERALPVEGMAPGRNVGILYENSLMEERLSLALGGFLATGSYSTAGEARDSLSEAAGYNLSGRMTFLPWHRDLGRRLFHLGLSYSHQFRDEADEDAKRRLRARPESRIKDVRLVDTGKFSTRGSDLMGVEMAVTHGPFSLQGEWFLNFTQSDAEDDPDFRGHYVYAGYVLTGENRGYKKSRGVFAGITPKNSFRPFKGGWGALELALRYSYLDLNDENIRGGKESNITAGLNWYLSEKTRFMVNYIRARVEDRGKPALDEGEADIVQARFQWSF